VGAEEVGVSGGKGECRNTREGGPFFFGEEGLSATAGDGRTGRAELSFILGGVRDKKRKAHPFPGESLDRNS